MPEHTDLTTAEIIADLRRLQTVSYHVAHISLAGSRIDLHSQSSRAAGPDSKAQLLRLDTRTQHTIDTDSSAGLRASPTCDINKPDNPLINDYDEDLELARNLLALADIRENLKRTGDLSLARAKNKVEDINLKYTIIQKNEQAGESTS